MNKKKFFIFSPIFYANGTPHIGHLITLNNCSVISSYKKIRGYEVYFQTGSDEHGEKIFKTSKEKNMDLIPMIDINVKSFKKLLDDFDIKYDFFFRTTYPFHREKVQRYFLEMLRNGDIYFGEYSGKYCFSCEKYSLSDDDVCSSDYCYKKLEVLKQKSYFFKVSKYQKEIENFYLNNPNFLIPESSKNELFNNFLGKGLNDLCITRNDLEWGIPVPFNDNFSSHREEKMTIYVWFEALLNYLTSQKGEYCYSSKDENIEIVNLIGRDILRFHSIYLLAMIFSLKRRAPDKIISHGLLVSAESGDKISKSKGNFADPLLLLKRFDKEIIKYYLFSEINIYKGGYFSEDSLNSINIYLKDKLGNLLKRALVMIFSFREGVVPSFKNEEKNVEILDFVEYLDENFHKYIEKMNNYNINDASILIKSILESSNKILSSLEPWRIFSLKKESLIIDNILNSLVKSLIIISYMIYPTMPSKTNFILESFNLNLDYLLEISANSCKIDTGGIKINRDFLELNLF